MTIRPSTDGTNSYSGNRPTDDPLAGVFDKFKDWYGPLQRGLDHEGAALAAFIAGVMWAEEQLRRCDGPNDEALRLLGEWIKRAEAHPEITEFRGGYQPFLTRATREFLKRTDAAQENK